MKYRFRLTFHHITRGLFQFEDEFTTFTLKDGTELALTARDAGKLSEASQFDIEAGGFPDEKAARETGEWLRLRLRTLNCLLGLGLTIPVKDTIKPGFTDEIKSSVTQGNDAVILDSVEGLSIMPDDGKHAEIIQSHKMNVYPSDPAFLFKALDEIWPIGITLTKRTADALEILNRATSEASPRAKFLLVYLAAEQIIERGKRSDKAIALIEEFRKVVEEKKEEDGDIASLDGSLAALHERSFSNALIRIAEHNPKTVKIKGVSLRKFLSKCISLRNRIAHSATIRKNTDINLLSEGLREFVMLLIWAENKIPDLSLNMPPSTFSIPPGGFNFRIR